MINNAVKSFIELIVSPNIKIERIIENIGTRLTKIEVLLGPISFIEICCTKYPITDANMLIYIDAIYE